MDQRDITNRFTYHPPADEGQADRFRRIRVDRFRRIRAEGLQLAGLVNDLCPDGREKSLAITKIEEAVMWANAAIARNQE